MNKDIFNRIPGVIFTDSHAPSSDARLEIEWDGPLCRSSVINDGSAPIRANEVRLLVLEHSLPPDTIFYGEGFQMLSQTGGTLSRPEALASLTDPGHYKIPQPPDASAHYGVLSLSPPGEESILLGFASCRRFIGKFYVRDGSIEIVLDTENQILQPSERWEMEEFFMLFGPDRDELFRRLAGEIRRNHPPLPLPPVPTGWCSWYGLGAHFTSEEVIENLDIIDREAPGLEYVQIDDGYQAAMGDWLETNPDFGEDIRSILDKIAAKGFKPALWVAPFIAEAGSRVFQEHPDWFIHDDAGSPLRSDRVTFGGWRRGPWYALDGAHPEAREHLENLFRTMRDEWGVRYFKLDANFWGAMHGGRFHDPKATRIEAYRRGMEAILRGCGDGFLLGCNHPIWPSFGLIHGSRSSNDIGRSWDGFVHIGREALSRNWQNGMLWWNDPDCLLLTGDLPDSELQYHATLILATGGMLLSGDDLRQIRPDKLEMLKKTIPPTGVAATFFDAE